VVSRDSYFRPKSGLLGGWEGRAILANRNASVTAVAHNHNSSQKATSPIYRHSPRHWCGTGDRVDVRCLWPLQIWPFFEKVPEPCQTRMQRTLVSVGFRVDEVASLPSRSLHSSDDSPRVLGKDGLRLRLRLRLSAPHSATDPKTTGPRPLLPLLAVHKSSLCGLEVGVRQS